MRTSYSCLLAGLIILCSQPLFSQTILDNYKEKKSRFYVGADVGLELDDLLRIGSISPFVGFKITDKFSMGIEVPLEMSLNKSHAYKYSSYGANIFARYKLNDNFFLYTKMGIYRTKISANKTGAFVFPDGDVDILKEAWDVGFGYRTKGKWGLEAKLNYRPLAEYNKLSIKIGVSHKF